MSSSSTSLALQTRMEDVLENLPISGTTEYCRRQMIYGPQYFSKSIYLVVSGKVEISHFAEDGTEVLLEIVRPDELFGESAFLGGPPSERATAIEKVKLMTWPVADVEELVMKRPPLAVALLRVLAQRSAESTRRIESLTSESIERRLARSLLRFSERLGTLEEDGAVRMMPFTHELLSRYVGTSREVVTLYMNQFRKQGHVSYSRRGIVLNRDSLKTVLDRISSPSADRAS